MLQESGTTDISVAAKKVEARERAGLTSATPERMAKAGLENVEVGEGTLVQRIVDAPLDRMRARGELTDREYRAGEIYRSDHQVSLVDPGAPSVDWNTIGGGFGPRAPSMFSSQAIANARMSWRDITRIFPVGLNTLGDPISMVGTVLRLGLLEQASFTDIGRAVIPGKGRSEAIAAGKAALKIALAAAADHYRL